MALSIIAWKAVDHGTFSVLTKSLTPNPLSLLYISEGRRYQETRMVPYPWRAGEIMIREMSLEARDHYSYFYRILEDFGPRGAVPSFWTGKVDGA
jgi:hypothetical protein